MLRSVSALQEAMSQLSLKVTKTRYRQIARQGVARVRAETHAQQTQTNTARLPHAGVVMVDLHVLQWHTHVCQALFQIRCRSVSVAAFDACL